jgi:hypothetical protein
LAVFTEALLGVPQALCNFHNKSTEGMRWESFCVFCFEQWHECLMSTTSQVWASLQPMCAILRYTDCVKAFCVCSSISIPCVL